MTIIRSNTFNYYINQENVLFKVYNDALEADRKEKEEKVKKQSRSFLNVIKECIKNPVKIETFQCCSNA